MSTEEKPDLTKLQMHVQPFFPTPFTDIVSGIIAYERGPCTPLEMKMVNCLEAYGLRIGKDKCHDLMADFKECNQKTLQKARVLAMREERRRQYKAGERKKEFAECPPQDLF